MTLRRKIAGGLRRLAGRIDDTPRVTRAEIETKTLAIFAIPRKVNRYVEKLSFSNRWGGQSVLDNPLVVAAASDMERADPSLYAENPDMEAAIAAHRAAVTIVAKINLAEVPAQPDGPDIATMIPRPTLIATAPLKTGSPLPAKLIACIRRRRRVK